MQESTLVDAVAAVDLGSNSFHMVVARVVRDQLSIVDRLRERVQLVAGLDGSKRLGEDAQQRALTCIERFGERVHALPPGSVRAVGTSALRQARNARGFLARAEKALGHPIEIISGHEEARLIYLGVAHDLSDDRARRLVVDIGGGSTELIVGERFEALETDSLHMGCVTWSMRHFAGGEIRDRDMERAVLAARRELLPIERRYKALGWEECIGSSGTALAVEGILRANDWSERGITPRGLRKLRKELVDAGEIAKLEIPGLAPERVPVISGGVAILTAVVDALGIEEMHTAQGALREGVLYDLLGRIRHEDVRDRTIRSFCEHHHVDTEQTGRVKRTALALLEQVQGPWDLPEERSAQILSWAAELHEIGLSVSYGGHHHHGAYLVEHSEMPGFSRDDQLLLAALVGSHRRRIDKARFEALPASTQRPALQLCVLLRLAVVLNRARGQQALPAIAAGARKNGLVLSFPEGWLETSPLARADLEEEAARLAEADFELSAT